MRSSPEGYSGVTEGNIFYWPATTRIIHFIIWPPHLYIQKQIIFLFLMIVVPRVIGLNILLRSQCTSNLQLPVAIV